MKKISLVLALFALVFADLAMARAVVSSLSGTAQAQGASGTTRTLRLGDEVNQGETVSTGAGSSVVLRFEDGQVAALTANTRMQVTTYQYNPQQSTGSVLLSLISGGMRAVTGLIGRNSPQTVSYKAATATIGIRGTDVIIHTIPGSGVPTVKVTVLDGEISFKMGDKTITLRAGEGVNARTDADFKAQAINDFLNTLTQAEKDAFGGLSGLTLAVSKASAGSDSVRSTTQQFTAPPGGSGGGGTSKK